MAIAYKSIDGNRTFIK